MDERVVAWLMEGDPSIRWQTMRDLLDAPEVEWQAERSRIQSEGDGAKLLGHQNPDGGWGEGIYSPKWTSTTYTLLLMRDMGFDGSCKEAARGGGLILNRLRRSKLPGRTSCTCVVGMWLALGLRFAPPDPVYGEMAEHLLTQQLGDGGWNCRWPRIRKTHHSSFHTTLNVLDGIRECLNAGVGPITTLRRAEDEAIELLLQHKLFRSDKTGQIINPKFLELHYPYRWHYDVLRALDYIRETKFTKDPRLSEAHELLRTARKPDGRWPAAKTYSGRVFFPLEKGREGSRWNTLRALRCLRAAA